MSDHFFRALNATEVLRKAHEELAEARKRRSEAERNEQKLLTELRVKATQCQHACDALERNIKGHIYQHDGQNYYISERYYGDSNEQCDQLVTTEVVQIGAQNA